MIKTIYLTSLSPISDSNIEKAKEIGKERVGIEIQLKCEDEIIWANKGNSYEIYYPE